MRLFILFLILFYTCHNINAQSSDDLIIHQIERMSEGQDGECDYSEMIESYWSLADNPININGDEIDQLAEFKFINVFQLENIKKYRKDFGNILFINELYEVEGLDSLSIEMIKPLICFQDRYDNQLKLKDMHKYGRNKILLEFNQCLNEKKGYDDKNGYLGNPQKIYLRYNYSFRDKIEAGFVLEKDPGEYVLKQNINDSILKLLGDKCYTGFDFFSFHVSAKDIKFIKTLNIGDYKLSFGQGLTMGSGMAFVSRGESLLRRNKKIVASKSANEAYYLRGIATTLRHKDFELSIFYSNKKTDANIITYDSLSEKPMEISSLQQSGLHRTYNEIIDRKVIRQQLYGLNLSYRNSDFQIGYTLHQTLLDADLKPDNNIYNTFYFRGRKLTNQGIDFYYILRNVLFYGEIAICNNKGLAGIIGTTFQPSGYIGFTLLYRNYAKDYQCLYSNAFASGSNTINEEGFYLSSVISIATNWKLITSFDYYRSNWFKSTAYSPSLGYEFDSQLNYQPDKNALLFIEYRNKHKTKNTVIADVYQKYLIEEKTNMIRFHAAYNTSNNITFKNRIEYHFNNYEDSKYHSYLIYQDIIYNPGKAYSIALRYELFNAEKGNVYAYENDVSYTFGVNSLSDKGMRTYIVGKIKLWEQLQLSGKIGFTFYNNKNEIGSGFETIEGNWKGDGKLQILWSF